MLKPILLVSAITCLGASLPGYASDWKVGGFVESVAINTDIARREGVDDAAYGLGAEISYLPQSWLDISMGLGLIMYDDQASFSQTVQGSGLFNSGNISTESSDAEGLLYYLELGPRYGFLEDSLSASLKLGVAGLKSDRSIANCADCYEETIHIDAGSYIQLGLAYHFESWEMLLKYNSYTGDEGLDNQIRVDFRTR